MVNWLSTLEFGMDKFAEPLKKIRMTTPSNIRSLTEADLKAELGMVLGECRAFLRKSSELPNVDHWSQVVSNKSDRMTRGV